jgi:L-ribulose-5-phosphate 4-epimerase
MSDARNRARHEVITYSHRIQAEHLVYSTAGNVSTRIDGEPDVIAITPTSLAYDAPDPEDICIVTTGGELIDGRREPTSELPLHTLLYARRPEVGAIIHTHSPAAMTMAVLGWSLPPAGSSSPAATGAPAPAANLPANWAQLQPAPTFRRRGPSVARRIREGRR